MEDLRPPGQGGDSVAPQGPLKHMHWLASLFFAQKFYKIKSFNCNIPWFTERIEFCQGKTKILYLKLLKKKRALILSAFPAP